MKKYQSTIEFCIIGLGRFGTALSYELASLGSEVLVLDKNESKIKHMQNSVAQALVCENLDKSTLVEAGIKNCETVIVCIGEDIQTSIITALNVIELGVPRVIARAVSLEHGRVLSKIGAEVIYPEKERAIYLAKVLTHSRAIDHLELSNEFAISEFKLNYKYVGKSIQGVDFRKRFGLNIIAINNEQDTMVELSPDYIFQEEDNIVVIGSKINISSFEKTLQE